MKNLRQMLETYKEKLRNQVQGDILIGQDSSGNKIDAQAQRMPVF